MKRSIVLAVLACTAAVGLFAGGGREASSGGGGKKTIEFWHIQNTEPAPTFIGNAVRRFEAANPDYKVNITLTANDSYKQKIAVLRPGSCRMCLCLGRAARQTNM